MTDFGELSALRDKLQAAELEVSRLRRELTDTTTELREARDYADQYHRQLVAKIDKLKRHSPVLAYLGEDGTWSDMLKLAMCFGKELAEYCDRVDALVKHNMGSLPGEFLKWQARNDADDREIFGIKTPDPKEAPLVAWPISLDAVLDEVSEGDLVTVQLDQNRPLGQDEGE